MCTSVALRVRKNGQGKEGFKHPVLFPKLSFFYDENLHGKDKELEWLFLEAIDCSSKSMYPDFMSCTGDGYIGDVYRKYGKTISRMGCVDGDEEIELETGSFKISDVNNAIKTLYGIENTINEFIKSDKEEINI